MSLVQKIAAKLAPGAEAESKTWCYTCPACKAEGNAWDLGWVITGVRSKGHTRAIECPACHAKVKVTLEKRGS
jgi:DNA-directed RNA polymerase subunit RPC12/RpoP